MNDPTTPYDRHRPAVRDATALEVHHPTPLAPVPYAAPLVPVQPGHIPAVASIVLPDGRVVTGYAISPVQPEPLTAKPAATGAATPSTSAKP